MKKTKIAKTSLKNMSKIITLYFLNMCSLFDFNYISIGLFFFNEGKHHPDIMNIPDIGLCKGLDKSAMTVSLPNPASPRGKHHPVFYGYPSFPCCFRKYVYYIRSLSLSVFDLYIKKVMFNIFFCNWLISFHS